MLELRFINRSYSAVPIDRPRITLGSDPGNDVVLPEDGIAGFQMEFYRHDGQVIAIDLIGDACLRNGQRFTGREEIGVGDVLSLESIQIEVVDPMLVTEKFDVADLHKVDRAPDAELESVLAAANDGSSAWSLRGINESVQGLRFPLAGKVVIGRDPNCDLVLNTPQVSRRHCEVEVLNSQLYIRDLGSTNGCQVNGETVTTAVVRAGDYITVDLIKFLVEGPENEQENTVARNFPIVAESGDKPYLLIRTGERAGEKVHLSKAHYTVGRTGENDIVLEDSSVSRHHANLIRTSDGGWKIEDCETTNGTSINGEMVMGGQLHHADRIRIGNIKLAFIVPESQRPEAESSKVASGGFDPNATVKTNALERPREFTRTHLYSGLAVAVIALVSGITYLFSLGGKIAEVPEPITEALTISMLWERQLPAQRSYPTASTVADVNGDRYLDIATADGAGHLLVLDGEEGKRIFDMPVTGRIVAAPVATDLTGDAIDDLVVASADGVIYAINGKAQVIWKTGSERGYGLIRERPELVDLDGDGVDEIVFSSRGKGVVALEAATGRELWTTASHGLLGVEKAPLLVDLDGDNAQELIVSSDLAVVWAFDVSYQNVEPKWTRELPEGELSAAVAVVGDESVVVLVSESSGVYGISASSGLINWRYGLHAPYHAPPVVVQQDNGSQHVVVISDQGVVTSLASEEGSPRWQRDLSTTITAPPALFDVTNDGVSDLVLTDHQGNLFVLDAASGVQVLQAAVSDTGILVSPTLGDVNNDQLVEVLVADRGGVISAHTLNRSLPTGAVPWAIPSGTRY